MKKALAGARGFGELCFDRAEGATFSRFSDVTRGDVRRYARRLGATLQGCCSCTQSEVPSGIL